PGRKKSEKKLKLRIVIFRPRFEKTLQIPSAGKEKNYKTNRILQLQSVSDDFRGGRTGIGIFGENQ
ncbi:hypothetical protein, partial [Alistipes finegoldii]|uniref:hypothetical protein n=1 Tax=Alistipes finegoldii TaxID=214856 RepID=UPI003AB27276